MPQYLFNTSTTFFSTEKILDEESVYKHNAETHQNFYGIKYPHIVDFIVPQNPLEQKTSSSIVLNSKAYQKDLATNSWKVVPKTYTQFIGYNSYQTTGNQTLINKDTAFMSDDISNITLSGLTDSQWRLNNIRDLTIDNNLPIWNYSWSAKASSPYFYIDREPNASNINYSKSLYETSRLKDHYLGARFILNSTEDYKLVTDLASGSYQNKNR